MSTERIEINLASKADTSGADQMAAAMGKTAGAAEKAAPALAASSKASQEMARGLGKSLEVGNATSSLLQNIGNASQGGATGLFAIGRAAIAFGQIIKVQLAGAGPVGWAVAALGLLAGAIFALKDKFSGSGASADEFGRKIAALNQAKLEAVKTELEGISTAASEGEKQINAEYAAMQKLADAQLALDIARTRAKGLPKEQEEAEVKRLQRAREDSKVTAEQSRLDQLSEQAAIVAAEKEQIRQRMIAERDIALGKRAAADQAAANEASARNLKADEYGDYTKSQLEYADAKAAKEKAEAAAKGITSESIETLNKLVIETSEAAQAAAKAAEEASRAAESNRSSQGDIRPLVHKTWQAEDQAAANNSPAAQAAREAERQKQIEQMQRVPAATWRERAASGWKVDASIFKSAFPDEKQPMDPVSDAIKGATQAVKEQPDGSDAAAAAKELESATQEHAAAAGAASSATVAALQTAAQFAGTMAQSQANVVSTVNALSSRMVSLEGRVSAMRITQMASTA